MPVFRYRDPDEASRAGWLLPGDPAMVQRWEALWALSKLAPSCPSRRGVRKFRSIEEANQDREVWVQECVRVGQARCVPDSS